MTKSQKTKINSIALAYAQNNDWESTLKALLQSEQDITAAHQWKDFLPILELVPDTIKLSSAKWAQVTARVLACAWQDEAFEAFVHFALKRYRGSQAAPIRLEQALVLASNSEHAAAEKSLDLALKYLRDTRRGIALRRWGRSQHALGHEWQESFEQAEQLIPTKSREHGLLLLDKGTCLYWQNQTCAALEAWLKALPILKRDPFHLASVHHCLGWAYLRECNSWAEHHFKHALDLSRQEAVSPLRSSIWHGIAAWHRHQGQWGLAETAYKKAINSTNISSDRSQIYTALARCLRLQSRITEALEVLNLALHESSNPSTYLEMAACLLVNGQIEKSESQLQQATSLQGSDVFVKQILEAELQRLQEKELLVFQPALNVNNNLVREEAGFWKLLFEKIRLNLGTACPTGLDHQQRTHNRVKVNVIDGFQVLRDGERIDLTPNSKSAQLLVLLLESQNYRNNAAVLASQLWDKDKSIRAEQQNLSYHVRFLRDKLGWNESIRYENHECWLAPDAFEFDLSNSEHTVTRDQVLLGFDALWCDEIRDRFSPKK